MCGSRSVTVGEEWSHERSLNGQPKKQLYFCLVCTLAGFLILNRQSSFLCEDYDTSLLLETEE